MPVDGSIPGLVPTTASNPLVAEVKWGSRWYKARIIKSEYGMALVKYDGYEKEFFDEWVTLDRIRPIGSDWKGPDYARPTPHGQKPKFPATPE